MPVLFLHLGDACLSLVGQPHQLLAAMESSVCSRRTATEMFAVRLNAASAVGMAALTTGLERITVASLRFTRTEACAALLERPLVSFTTVSRSLDLTGKSYNDREVLYIKHGTNIKI